MCKWFKFCFFTQNWQDVVAGRKLGSGWQEVDAAVNPESRRQRRQRRSGHHVLLAEQDEQRNYRYLHGPEQNRSAPANTMDLLVTVLLEHSLVLVCFGHRSTQGGGKVGGWAPKLILETLDKDNFIWNEIKTNLLPGCLTTSHPRLLVRSNRILLIWFSIYY